MEKQALEDFLNDSESAAKSPFLTQIVIFILLGVIFLLYHMGFFSFDGFLLECLIVLITTLILAVAVFFKKTPERDDFMMGAVYTQGSIMILFFSVELMYPEKTLPFARIVYLLIWGLMGFWLCCNIRKNVLERQYSEEFREIQALSKKKGILFIKNKRTMFLIASVLIIAIIHFFLALFIFPKTYDFRMCICLTGLFIMAILNIGWRFIMKFVLAVSWIRKNK